METLSEKLDKEFADEQEATRECIEGVQLVILHECVPTRHELLRRLREQVEFIEVGLQGEAAMREASKLCA